MNVVTLVMENLIAALNECSDTRYTPQLYSSENVSPIDFPYLEWKTSFKNSHNMTLLGKCDNYQDSDMIETCMFVILKYT